MCSSCCQVYVVISGTGAYNDFQLFGSVEHFGIHHVAADDDGVYVLYGLQQFGLFAVFLQQHQLVACCFYFLTDAVYSHFGKRLICCN